MGVGGVLWGWPAGRGIDCRFAAAIDHEIGKGVDFGLGVRVFANPGMSKDRGIKVCRVTAFDNVQSYLRIFSHNVFKSLDDVVSDRLVAEKYLFLCKHIKCRSGDIVK